jgi:hypothetical protein
VGRRSQHGKRAGSFYVECEELLRQAQCCIARAAMVTDPDGKAALLEMAAMLEGLVERAKTGEREWVSKT